MVSVLRRRNNVLGIETAVISRYHSGSAQFAIRRVPGQVLHVAIALGEAAQLAGLTRTHPSDCGWREWAW